MTGVSPRLPLVALSWPGTIVIRSSTSRGSHMTQLRVLLTGSSGYLGHAVRRQLERGGHAVTLLGRALPEDTPHRSIQADLRDSRSLRHALDQLEVDVVCHLAALTKARESVEQPL